MDNKFAGMTVNERLWASGLMEKFEEAVKERSTEKARAILTEVELTENNIIPILKKHGLVK